MSSEWTQQEVEETVREIRRRAAQDREFRELALRDPAAAVKEIAGKEIPEGYKLEVIESKPGVHHTMVLPPMDDELDDEVLDSIAGGRGCICHGGTTPVVS